MADGLRKLYYDLEVAESAGLDYKTFMERRWVQDLSGAITKSAAGAAARLGGELEKRTGEIRDAMYRNSGRIMSAIDDQTSALAASNEALGRINEAGFTRVNNTLEAGFAGVSGQLGGISEQLGELGAAFALGAANVVEAVDKMSQRVCDKLDAIHDAVNNPLLTQARELYRRAAVNYRKGFYEEARDDLKAAVEKNRTDYISWFLLGKAYLLGVGEFSNTISLEDSLAALTNTAKYLSPDISADADARLLAAEVWFYLGLAKLVRSHEMRAAEKAADRRSEEPPALLAGARDAFERSYAYSPRMLESLYNIARCRTLLGDRAGALEALKAAVTRDAAYSVKAEIESDFAPIRGEYRLLITEMRDEVYEKALSVFANLRANYARAEGEGLLTYFSGDALFVDQLRRALNKDLPYVDMRDRYEELTGVSKRLAEEIRRAKEARRAAEEARRAAESARAREAAAYVASGREYYEKSDYDRAIADLTEAIRLEAEDALAYIFRGHAYQGKNAYDRAIADYTEAIRLKPESPGGYRSRAWTYEFCKRDHDRAVEDYTAVIRLEAGHADDYSSRGNAYRNKRDYDRAIADYTEAIRLKPKDAHAYLCRGHAYLEKGDYDRAIADYTEAIRLKPKDAHAYSSRSHAYLEKGDYDRSIADYTEALRLDPKNDDYLKQMKELCLKKGVYDPLIAAYTEQIRLEPYGYLYWRRGEMYLKKGDYKRAIEDAATALRSAPEDDDYRKLLKEAKKARWKARGGPFGLW